MGLVTDIWQISYGNLIKKAFLHKMEKQGNRETGKTGFWVVLVLNGES